MSQIINPCNVKTYFALLQQIFDVMTADKINFHSSYFQFFNSITKTPTFVHQTITS
jgi:hypothetical protein